MTWGFGLCCVVSYLRFGSNLEFWICIEAWDSRETSVFGLTFGGVVGLYWGDLPRFSWFCDSLYFGFVLSL